MLKKGTQTHAWHIIPKISNDSDIKHKQWIRCNYISRLVGFAKARILKKNTKYANIRILKNRLASKSEVTVYKAYTAG